MEIKPYQEKYREQMISVWEKSVRATQERSFETLLVGTCDQCLKEIAYYKKSGFDVNGIRKNFFIENYLEPIFESGVQIKDMIMLSIDMKTI